MIDLDDVRAIYPKQLDIEHQRQQIRQELEGGHPSPAVYHGMLRAFARALDEIENRRDGLEMANGYLEKQERELTDLKAQLEALRQDDRMRGTRAYREVFYGEQRPHPLYPKE